MYTELLCKREVSWPTVGLPKTAFDGGGRALYYGRWALRCLVGASRVRFGVSRDLPFVIHAGRPKMPNMRGANPALSWFSKEGRLLSAKFCHLDLSLRLDHDSARMSYLHVRKLEPGHNIHALQFLDQQFARIWDLELPQRIPLPAILAPACVANQTTSFANVDLSANKSEDSG